MKDQLPLMLIAAIALGGVLSERTAARDVQSGEQIRVLFDGLRDRAAVVDRMVLTARLAMLPSYDPLVDSVAQLRQRLSVVRARFAEGDLPKLQGEPLELFERRVEATAERVEELKRMRAATRNSEKFLVSFLGQPSPSAAALPLRRSLALYLADPSQETTEQLTLATEQLADTEDAGLRLAAKHADVLRLSRRKLDELTRTFLKSNLVSDAAQLHIASARHRWAMDQRHHARRLALFALLVLIACVAAMARARARTASQPVN